jgi:rhodanese-related sulfurtransferase
MLGRLLAIISLAFAVIISGPAWSYDTEMAKSYAELFAPVKGAGAGKSLHMLMPDYFLDKIKAKEPLVALDVRTPAETDVYSVTLPGALLIPINELFTEANLARIPTDKTVVVICQTGARATAAGTALRHIGFENVYVLKGGFKALAGYMGPKEANTPPTQQPAQQATPQTKSTMPVTPQSSGWYPMPLPYPPRPTR